MNDLMKILLIIVALYGGWKLFGAIRPGDSGAKSASYSRGSGVGSTVKKPKVKTTKAEVDAAKRGMVKASQRLAAMQNSSAGAATQDRQVEYHGDYRHTQTLTYDNSGVNARSAAIKQATLDLQAAQKVYADTYRAYKASGGK